MFKTLLLAGFAAAAMSPAIANAQDCGPGNRVAGTVVGAGIGALLGSAISGGQTGGAIVGGVGGAVAGNAIAGANNGCSKSVRPLRPKWRLDPEHGHGLWVLRARRTLGRHRDSAAWTGRLCAASAICTGAGV